MELPILVSAPKLRLQYRQQLAISEYLKKILKDMFRFEYLFNIKNISIQSIPYTIKISSGKKSKKMVGRGGFEPTTNGLRVRCSTNWANAPFINYNAEIR